MRLISLNTWAGKAFDPLMDFLNKYSKETDIFCFQEILFGQEPNFTPRLGARINLFDEIVKHLPEFNSFTYVIRDNYHYEDEALPENTYSGLATFVKKSIKVLRSDGLRTFKNEYPIDTDKGARMTGSCQWLGIEKSNSSPTTIVNVHGLYQRNTHKNDTEERIVQSEILLDLLTTRGEKSIIAGDFNLLPETQSIKILERNLVNLIKDFRIKTTRTSLYDKPIKFADYVFISPGIVIREFKTLPEEVSDHLAVFLDFD